MRVCVCVFACTHVLCKHVHAYVCVREFTFLGSECFVYLYVCAFIYVHFFRTMPSQSLGLRYFKLLSRLSLLHYVLLQARKASSSFHSRFRRLPVTWVAWNGTKRKYQNWPTSQTWWNLPLLVRAAYQCSRTKAAGCSTGVDSWSKVDVIPYASMTGSNARSQLWWVCVLVYRQCWILVIVAPKVRRSTLLVDSRNIT